MLAGLGNVRNRDAWLPIVRTTKSVRFGSRRPGVKLTQKRAAELLDEEPERIVS